MGGVDCILAWMTYEHGWREWRSSVGEVGGVLPWQRGWCTKVSDVGDIGGNKRVVY